MIIINEYLLKRVLIGFGIIVMVFAVAYMGVYRPLVSRLREQTYKNYRLLASQKEMSVEQFLSRSMEGANSLSSRTMIRNAISDYLDGEITFDDLVSYTQPRYADGVNALGNVDAASRVVDGDIIAQVPVSTEAVMVEDVQDITTTEYMITSQDEMTFVIVISPIVHDGDIIGHDIVRFDMCDFLDELNENDEECTIIGLDERHFLLNEADVLLEDDGYVVFIKNQDIIYLSDGLANSDTVFIKVVRKASALETDIQEVTTRALIWTGVLFTLSFGAVAYLISREAASRVELVDHKKRMYQERANKDALTGVYTRHYLEEWVKRINDENDESQSSLTVVMCDVNGFKQYNDNHGHDAGDKALVDVGEMMTRYSDEDDVVIRYGGDEFLLVAKGAKKTRCEQVMKKINQALKQKDKLSLAYGITVATTPDQLESAINQADKKMYKNKNKSIS